MALTLRLISSVVAGIAVVAVLTALIHERRRELAVVRVLGGSRRQLFGLAEEGPIFGFNAQNELLLARTAMVGFAVTTLVEATSGRGPLEQLGFELGESGLKFEEDFFLYSAVFFLLSAVFPAGLSQIMPPTKSAK